MHGVSDMESTLPGGVQFLLYGIDFLELDPENIPSPSTFNKISLKSGTIGIFHNLY